MVANQNGHFWASGGGEDCFSGHLPKRLFDHFLVIFGAAGGQILALISPILEPDFVTFLSFLDAARGQILYVNPRLWRLFRSLFDDF